MDFLGTTFAILIGLMILIPTLKFVGGIIGFVISWIARICMQTYIKTFVFMPVRIKIKTTYYL